jgi:hypothetical protein
VKLRSFKDVWKKYKITPVLVDVGASGVMHKIWEPIADLSEYLGFDPDLREMRSESAATFKRSTIVNKAVCSDDKAEEVNFVLTRSPHCSSMLRPNSKALEQYSFYELFEVVEERRVAATTLNHVLKEVALPCIDWLKVDSQGCDLRIYQNLDEAVRNRLLAIEVEPGLINAYVDEDMFVDVHRKLSAEGFWLSDLTVRGSVRLSRSCLNELKNNHHDVWNYFSSKDPHTAPGWCEARYLRSVDWLNQEGVNVREYLVAWGFALLLREYGYAFDLVRQIGQIDGKSSLSETLWGYTKLCVKRRARLAKIRHWVRGAYRRMERAGWI